MKLSIKILIVVLILIVSGFAVYNYMQPDAEESNSISEQGSVVNGEQDAYFFAFGS